MFKIHHDKENITTPSTKLSADFMQPRKFKDSTNEIKAQATDVTNGKLDAKSSAITGDSSNRLKSTQKDVPLFKYSDKSSLSSPDSQSEFDVFVDEEADCENLKIVDEKTGSRVGDTDTQTCLVLSYDSEWSDMEHMDVNLEEDAYLDILPMSERIQVHEIDGYFCTIPKFQNILEPELCLNASLVECEEYISLPSPDYEITLHPMSPISSPPPPLSMMNDTLIFDTSF